MIYLERLKENWERLASRDALWAILTDESKEGSRWKLEEFMATGRREVDTVLSHLVQINVLPDFSGSALDFGCGVGRLTQALAENFALTIGVDISEEMIRRAETLNQYPHCRYLVNTGTRLPFADRSFHFIYSNIVLQHVSPEFATQYLREFVRVLTPNGVLVFGVQDSLAALGLRAMIMRLRQLLRIRSRIKVVFGLRAAQMEMHCLPESAVREALSDVVIVDVQMTNTAVKDFNGRLIYLSKPPQTGFIGRQYCVRKNV